MKKLFVILALAGMSFGVSASTVSIAHHNYSIVFKGGDKGKGKKKDKKCCSDSTKCTKGGCCKGSKGNSSGSTGTQK